MSLETGPKRSELSRIEVASQTIKFIEDLERDGIHAHSLIKSNPERPDAPILEGIEHAVSHEETKLPE